MIRRVRPAPLQAVRRRRVRPARATSSLAGPEQHRQDHASCRPSPPGAWPSTAGRSSTTSSVTAAPTRGRPSRARPSRAVPLRAFDLLWRERDVRGQRRDRDPAPTGWTLADGARSPTAPSRSTCGPTPRSTPDVVRGRVLTTVFVPAMSGLGTEEPRLPRARRSTSSWARPSPATSSATCSWRPPARRARGPASRTSIRRLFGFELVPPDATGAHILAEYRAAAGRTAARHRQRRQRVPAGPDAADFPATRARARCCCSTSRTRTCT